MHDALLRTARVDVRAVPPLATGLTDLFVIHESIAPATAYPLRKLEMMAILATESGRASVWDTRHRHEHRRGSLVVMPRGVRFEERVSQRMGWQVRYLMLRGPWVSALDRVLWPRRPRTILGLPRPPVPWHAADHFTVELNAPHTLLMSLEPTRL